MSNQVSVIHHQIADVQNTNPLSIKNHFDTCWRKIFHLSEKQRRALLIKSCFSFAFNICYDYLRRRVRPAGNWRVHYSYAKLRSKVDRISQAAENQGCVHIGTDKQLSLRPLGRPYTTRRDRWVIIG